VRHKGERGSQRSVVAEPGFQYKFRGGGTKATQSGGVFKAIGVQSVTSVKERKKTYSPTKGGMFTHLLVEVSVLFIY